MGQQLRSLSHRRLPPSGSQAQMLFHDLQHLRSSGDQASTVEMLHMQVQRAVVQHQLNLLVWQPTAATSREVGVLPRRELGHMENGQ